MKLENKRLCDALLQLKNENMYPFHMPGHKREMGGFLNILSNEEDSFGERLLPAYEIDITEIDGFDNLHDAKGIIKNSQDAARDLYGADETFFLVNGSTSGILSAISSVAKKGGKIIVGRNCHVSVFNGIEICGLEPVYVYPEIIAKEMIPSGICGSIRKEDVEKAILENMDAVAIVITSPTYDGVLSDCQAIAKLAHEYDIPLIVDEAHGALFFMEGRSAVKNGADIVINSVHKTMPSLTQTALLHVNGNLVSRDRLKKYLKIYQTSSPSYVLMGSIDYAVRIFEENGRELYRDFCVKLFKLKDELRSLRNIKYVSKDELMLDGAFDYDESKILIASGNTSLSGKQIYNILRSKYKLQPEMAAGDYVLLMVTVFDSYEGIERLAASLREIDKEYQNVESIDETEEEIDIKKLVDSIGKPSEYTVYAYPPGIPIIAEGEIVTEDAISEIEIAIKKGLDIKGL